jgi:hypothetical protein
MCQTRTFIIGVLGDVVGAHDIAGDVALCQIVGAYGNRPGVPHFATHAHYAIGASKHLACATPTPL